MQGNKMLKGPITIYIQSSKLNFAPFFSISSKSIIFPFSSHSSSFAWDPHQQMQEISKLYKTQVLKPVYCLLETKLQKFTQYSSLSRTKALYKERENRVFHFVPITNTKRRGENMRWQHVPQYWVMQCSRGQVTMAESQNSAIKLP